MKAYFKDHPHALTFVRIVLYPGYALVLLNCEKCGKHLSFKIPFKEV